MQDVTQTTGGKWLRERAAVYVPGTRNISEPLSPEDVKQAVDETARFLSSLFGGATALPAQGYYVATDGALVSENITIVYSYTEHVSTEQYGKIKLFAEQLRNTYGQEAVTIEVNGAIEFI